MSVSHHFKPGLSGKAQVMILTVDTVSRRVEGALKDGSMIHIAVWDTPAAFRWPIEGEVWNVRRDQGIWVLGNRVQQSREQGTEHTPTPPITAMQPGDLRLDSNVVTDGRGYRLAPVLGDPIQGDLPAWDTYMQAFIPSAPATTSIPDGFITGSMIAGNTITGTNIADATITSGNITVGAITGDLIASNTIAGTNIQKATITTGNITSGAITGDLIAINAVSGNQIGNATITGGNIATGTIAGDNIQINTIVGGPTGNLATGTITGDNIGTGTITGSLIAANTIGAGLLAAGAVVAGTIAAGAVTAGTLAVGAVTAGTIAAGAVTAASINVTSLGAITATLGTVNSGTITSTTITGGTIIGATVETAITNPKVVMSGADNALEIYNSSGAKLVQLDGTAGLQLTTGGSTTITDDHAVTWADSTIGSGLSGYVFSGKWFPSGTTYFTSMASYHPGSTTRSTALTVNANVSNNTYNYAAIEMFDTVGNAFGRILLDGNGASQFLQTGSGLGGPRAFSTVGVATLAWHGGQYSVPITVAVPGASLNVYGVGTALTSESSTSHMPIVGVNPTGIGSADIYAEVPGFSATGTCQIAYILWGT